MNWPASAGFFALTLMGCAGISPAPVEPPEFFKSVLGADFVNCGVFDEHHAPHESRRPSKRARSCALQAQAQRRAFVYRYEEVAPPDVAVTHTAIFGAQGEQVLLQYGDFGDMGVNFAGVCRKLEIRPDGWIEHADCSDTDPLIERYRLKN